MFVSSFRVAPTFQTGLINLLSRFYIVFNSQLKSGVILSRTGLDNKMVYYFKSSVVDPAAFIYVGKDKVESLQDLLDIRYSHTELSTDEDLIKFGWEEDVW